MKKLILFLLLCFSLSTFAQDKKEFIRTYTKMYTIKDGQSQGWKNAYCKTYFNYGNDTTKVRFIAGDVVIDVRQVESTVIDKTVSGLQYQAMTMLNDETGEYVILQLFDSEEYGIRILFDENNSIQFTH